MFFLEKVEYVIFFLPHLSKKRLSTLRRAQKVQNYVSWLVGSKL